jgi:hypothetical protein
VDTGAFVTSWTITDRSNKGRSRSSNGRPKTTYEAAQAQAQELQAQDLASLPDEIDRIYLNNRAPHAGFAMGVVRGDEIADVKQAFFDRIRESFQR